MKKRNSILMLLLGVVVMSTSCKKDKKDKDDVKPIVQTITVSGVINTPVTWLAANTYIVDGSLTVEGGGVLTIEPGTTIKFNAGSYMEVGYASNGTVIANGTAEKPITFTSSALLPTAGAWGGIRLYDYALNNTIFNYCVIKYAGDYYYGAFAINNCKLTVTNCTFTNNGGPYTIFMYDGSATDGFTLFSGNTFSANSGDALKLPCNFATQISAANTIACEAGKGIRLTSEYNLSNATLNNLIVPYVVGDSHTLYVSGQLNVAPGCTFLMESNSAVAVGDGTDGYLNAAGTAAQPITFTTSQATPAPGAWQGIHFRAEAHPSCNLTNCVISYGGSNSYFSGNVSVLDCTVKIKDCAINNSERYGITLRGVGVLTATSTGNTFSGNALGEIGDNP